MPGTCITCLATQNLVDLGEFEWKVFDFLLHPLNKVLNTVKEPVTDYRVIPKDLVVSLLARNQYSDIRNNKLARLCSSCQHSMGFVEKFRLHAVNKFVFLMKVWNWPQTSINVDKDPLNISPVVMKSQCDTFIENENLFVPKTTNSCSYETEFSHTLKEEEAEVEAPYKEEVEVPLKEKDEIPLENISGIPEDNVKTEVDDVHEEKEIKREEIDVQEKTGSEGGTIVDENEEFDILWNDDKSDEESSTKSPPAAFPSNSAETLSKLQCRYCNKSFKHNLNKIQHEEIQHGNLSLETCTLCKKTVKNKYSLYNHMKFMHTNSKIFCDVCDKWFQTRHYRQHLKTPKHKTENNKEEPKYQCKHCNKPYKYNFDKIKHEQIYHSNLPSETCTICKKTVKNKYSLDRHMKNIHLRMYNKLFCDVCDKWFARTSYKRHLQDSPKHNKLEDLEARKVSCTICNKILTNERSLKTHMELHTDAKYCKPCGKWFSPSTYKVHIATSSKHLSMDDRQFTCDECNVKYARKTDLRDHIQTKHLKIVPFQNGPQSAVVNPSWTADRRPQPYKCPNCPCKFASRRTRSRHIRAVHKERDNTTEERVCEVCGKTLKNAKTLANHMRIHTGARPYKCGKCSSAFGHHSSLYLHNKYVHEKKKNPYNEKKKSTATNKTAKNTSSIVVRK